MAVRSWWDVSRGYQVGSKYERRQCGAATARGRKRDCRVGRVLKGIAACDAVAQVESRSEHVTPPKGSLPEKEKSSWAQYYHMDEGRAETHF